MRRVLFAVPAITAAAFALAACSSAPSSTVAGGADQADSWTSAEDPANLIPGADTKLADIISAADIGQQFGVDADHVPYPDTYWPFTDGGVDAHWNGSNPSPLEKFLGLMGSNASDTQAAKDWENQNHGAATPGVADWWGHCPGWTGAAMSNAPLKHAVNAKLDSSGAATACAEGSSGCTKFEIGDVNALEAESWVDGQLSFLGARCDTSPANIKRDEFGRIDATANGAGCRGLNAGALMVVLGNRMKKQHLAMAIDAQSDFNTDQIWNQPSYAYKVYSYAKTSQADAIKLVSGGQALSTYKWNTEAKGFATVDIGIQWVREYGPNITPYPGTSSTREMRFTAVLELDGDAASPDTKILGGEYYASTASGTDRLTVPPFVWISLDSAADVEQTYGHNPGVKPSVVKQLVALGAE